MNFLKKTVVWSSAAILLASVFSCGPIDTGTGDIPKPSLSIPKALTGSSSREVSKATSAGGTAENFFEPFRSSLELGENVLEFVYSIIDSLNSTTVPDSWTGTANNGDYVTVTTDTARTYSKRIEFKSSESAASPYLQVNYNPGTVKGEIYYAEEDSTSDLDKIKVFYDETGSYPVLKVWVAIKDGTETYPTSLYFNATKNSSDKIVVEGGVVYNYVFGGSTDYPEDYVSERAYMYKALCSSDGTKAEVALYFPETSVTTTDLAESVNIKNSFLDILFEWLETENGEDLDGSGWLTTAYGEITDGSSLGTAIGGYVDGGGTLDDSIAFVLNLENNIAYSEANGYEGNENNDTDPFPSSFDMGDLSGISFSLSPASIAELTSASSTFDFPTD